MKKLTRLLMIALLSLAVCNCSNAAEKMEGIRPTTKKGAHGMKTYYIGRFAIDVPADFKLELHSQEFQYAEIEEIEWPVDVPREVARSRIWEERISVIKKLEPPEKVGNIIVKRLDIKKIGQWCNGVLYYGNDMSSEDGQWEVLVDVGPVGLWIKLDGLIEYEEEMLSDIRNIAKSYQFVGSSVYVETLRPGGFYLQRGVVALPYFEQENAFARFEGPMGMVLKVEMNEIHKAPKKEGIADRTIAAIATGFAAGLDIEKVRSRKRTAAGLPGEEEILLGDDGEFKNVSFDWEYLGSVESGEKPMILITIDTDADNLAEKIKIWDKILSSFRPAY